VKTCVNGGRLRYHEREKARDKFDTISRGRGHHGGRVHVFEGGTRRSHPTRMERAATGRQQGVGRRAL